MLVHRAKYVNEIWIQWIKRSQSNNPIHRYIGYNIKCATERRWWRWRWDAWKHCLSIGGWYATQTSTQVCPIRSTWSFAAFGCFPSHEYFLQVCQSLYIIITQIHSIQLNNFSHKIQSTIYRIEDKSSIECKRLSAKFTIVCAIWNLPSMERSWWARIYVLHSMRCTTHEYRRNGWRSVLNVYWNYGAFGKVIKAIYVFELWSCISCRIPRLHGLSQINENQLIYVFGHPNNSQLTWTNACPFWFISI